MSYSCAFHPIELLHMDKTANTTADALELLNQIAIRAIKEFSTRIGLQDSTNIYDNMMTTTRSTPIQTSLPQELNHLNPDPYFGENHLI
ncbi:hypothetical protein D3C76_467190 [compost metagenome]